MAIHTKPIIGVNQTLSTINANPLNLCRPLVWFWCAMTQCALHPMFINHIDLSTSGIIKQNLMMKKVNIDMPSQKLKCIAMTKPKNAPAKCKAKYNAINISFIYYLI